jgi:DNA polymerase elongation subunit (family B)
LLEHGGVVLEIHSALLCKNYIEAIKDYVLDIEAMRVSSQFGALCAKTLINSLYGRLGIGRLTTQTVVESTAPSDTTPYIKIHDHYLHEQAKSTNTKANIAIAAAVTAKARTWLYETCRMLQLSGGRMLYCDTDSIVWAVDKNDKQNWEQKLTEYIQSKHKTDAKTNEPGRFFKIKDAVFIAPKTYSIVTQKEEHICKIKGVTKPKAQHGQMKKYFYENAQAPTEAQLHITNSGYTNQTITLNKQL